MKDLPMVGFVCALTIVSVFAIAFTDTKTDQSHEQQLAEIEARKIQYQAFQECSKHHLPTACAKELGITPKVEATTKVKIDLTPFFEKEDMTFE